MRGNVANKNVADLTLGSGRWYAANVRPNAERAALAHLSRQGFRSFLPTRLKTIRHARQFRTSIAPLFPGYLFVSLDISRERWRSVNGTVGVVSLVMTGNEPLPVPQGVIETLIDLSSENGIVQFEKMQAGQRVKILTGPFAEQCGTLDSLDDRGRVHVLLDMMGMSISVISKSNQLAPA
jgi:transcription elongation factor/antiterminator RfaH